MALSFPKKVLSIPEWGTGPLFVLDFVYLAVLALLLIGRPAHFLDIDRIPNPIGGLIPAGVVWFGAVGAVTVSFYGLFDHNGPHWDKTYNYWHVARPFMGAMFAVVAYLIFIGLINATGGTPSAKPQGDDVIPYLVVGFVVGFREATFRLLLQKAIDLLLGPGIPGQTPSPVAMTTDPAVLPTAVAGDKQAVNVTISNPGTSAHTLGTVNAYVTPSDAATCVVDPFPSTIAPSGHVSFTATVTVAGTASYTVQLVGTGDFGAASVVLRSP